MNESTAFQELVPVAWSVGFLRAEPDDVATVAAEWWRSSGRLTQGGNPLDVPGYAGYWVERADRVRVGWRASSKSVGEANDIRCAAGTTHKIQIQE
jgi:hypothetical protein